MPAAKSRAALERKERSARVTRITKETEISVELTVDGGGRAAVDTGVPFLNHMLDSFARHGFFDRDGADHARFAHREEHRAARMWRHV